jgi:RND family efflux transporter MFP subunit
VKRTPLVLVLALPCLLCSCEEDGPEIDIESAIPVSVETVESKPIREYVFATGSVSAAEDIRLSTEQAGHYRLQTNPRSGQPFEMGDAVQRGEVIVILENAELENQVMIDSKRLNHEISEREFNKQKSLYEKGGVTFRELTDAERAAIDARYAYENAIIQLEKLKVKAPLDGVLVDLDYHTAGEWLPAGTPVARVMDYSRLYCELALPGSEMERVSDGQTALVTNYVNPLDTLKGRITQVSPALDPTSRMFQAAVIIDNDSLVLHPGMFVKVDLVVAEKDSAVVIPQEVVVASGSDRRAFVVEKGIAVERKLEIGLANPLEVEVLSGLEPGERLVVKGFETVRHRARVKVLD